MFISIRTASTWLARRWLISTVLLFALLMAYTSIPIFGQSAPPTPDIQTVPPPAMVATPPNTPFPTATPVAVATEVTSDIPQVPSPVATQLTKPDKNNDSSSDANNNTNNTDDKTGDSTTGNSGTGDIGNASGDAQTTKAQPPNQTNGALTGTVLIPVLNLRKGPGANHAIIDTLFRNDVVQILARSADGVWWLVCCGADSKHQGWITTQFIRPNFNRAQANSLLPIGANSSAAPPSTKTDIINKAPTLSQSITTTTHAPMTSTLVITQANGARLQFQMRPSPAFVWQGQLVNLQLFVTNPGPTTAINVRVRDDLPLTLRYAQAIVSHNGRFQQASKAQGGSIISIDWPQLAAGATLTATLTLRVAADIPDGSLIDNLAVVAADNVGDIAAGVTLAMPPVLLPAFK